MHDLAYFRNNFEQIAARLATRSNPPNLDRLREFDARRPTRPPTAAVLVR